MIRAVFLDRDGVINRKAPEGAYITRWEDFEFLPGVAESIGQLNLAGFAVIVITNQRCIAKGLLTVAELETMHRRMADVLARAGATIDAIYFCPHEADQSCDCRKPAPGMLLEAARAHSIEMERSWMIGDSDHDIAAGKRAGCRTVLLTEASQTADEPGRPGAARNCADLVAHSLRDAVRQVLRMDRAAVGSLTAGPAAI